MSLRIFLLGLCFLASTVGAQENAPNEPAQTPVAPATPAAPAESPTEVPLDPSALLAAGAPRSKEERDEIAARAVTLHTEADQHRREAEQAYADAKVACWKKFLVSSCLEDARTAYRKNTLLAKRQEREAQTLERNVRKFDALERARLRDEENARREAENEKKAERYRAKHTADTKAKPAAQ